MGGIDTYCLGQGKEAQKDRHEDVECCHFDKGSWENEYDKVLELAVVFPLSVMRDLLGTTEAGGTRGFEIDKGPWEVSTRREGEEIGIPWRPQERGLLYWVSWSESRSNIHFFTFKLREEL